MTRPGTAPTLLLGLLTVVALYVGAAHTTTDMQPKGCTLDWCKPKPMQPHDAMQEQLQGAADAARAGEGRACVPPAQWRKGELPAAMVLGTTPHGGAVTVESWTYPAPDGAWVLKLCAR